MLYTLITTRYRNRKSSRSSEWAVNNEYSQYRFIHSRRYCNSGGSAGTLTALKRRENSCIKGLCRLLVYYNIVVYSSRYSLYWQTFISWCLIYFLTRNLAIANRSRILAAPKWPSTVTQGHLYDFLLPFHSNYGPILYRFPHIAKYLSKIAKFIYATCIQRPRSGLPRRNYAKIFRAGSLGKLEWPWLRMPKKSLLSRFVTDGQRGRHNS